MNALLWYIVSLLLLSITNNAILVPASQDIKSLTANGTTNSTDDDGNATLVQSLGNVLTDPLAQVLAIVGLIFAAAAVASPQALGSGADRGGVAVAGFATGLIIVFIPLMSGLFNMFALFPEVGVPAFALYALSGFAIMFDHSMRMLAGGGGGT